LEPVLGERRLLAALPPVAALRARREGDVAWLSPGVRRLVNPHI
jgi:hypothetical protein